MKIFRVAFIFAVSFIVSFFLAMNFFNYSDHKTIDRVFLVLVPTLAIAYLLFEISPTLWNRLGQNLHQFQKNHSIGVYLVGFLLTCLLAFAAAGFLTEALKTTFNLILFTGGLTLAGSVVGYYLVRRAAHSLQDGFLSQPLNIILCLVLPLFLFATILASVQFPSMFIWEYITVPSKWVGWFIASTLFAGTWSIGRVESI